MDKQSQKPSMPPREVQQNTDTHKKSGFDKRSTKLLLLVVLVALIGVIAYGSYNERQLDNKISTLEKNQLPTKQFSNFDSCATNGGVNLYSINGEFNSCLEGGKQVILQYSAQNLPQVTANKTTTIPNIVLAASNSNSTSDLINYLTYSYTGCNIGSPKGSTVTGYYKVLKEIPSGWALLNYGCSNDTQANKNNTYIIAMELSSGWVQLSPTNNFLPNGTPSCLLVDMYKIPSSLTSQCFQNTGYNDGISQKRY